MNAGREHAVNRIAQGGQAVGSQKADG
jgi:hypothetical protein